MEKELERLVEYALHHQVSDLHFQVRDEIVAMQMRKNGQLVNCDDFSCDLRLFRYLQYRADMELSMSSVPQTGRFDLLIHEKKVSLRFATIQSYQMMDGVLRILNAENTLTMESLFPYPEHLHLMKQSFRKENGLILISGPTGSGKTTTLYTCLKAVSQRMIYTVEDPIEVFDERFVQIQVNEAQNFSYEQSIRQLMRHDPDIIMIGEIRDSAAAKGAVQSALTGHLVCATIHASSCTGAIERMKDLGVSESLLKDVLVLVSSQRLFESYRKEKIGAYEMMGIKDLNSYFESHKIPEGFHDLTSNVRWLEKHRFVSTFETEEMFL
ncbi:MAG: hypothetical protein E7192_04905 [Erysipelotrichaceae bacterium]|nr:hypothetical protein [Erysipelotrichaceae bacterium]